MFKTMIAVASALTMGMAQAAPISGPSMITATTDIATCDPLICLGLGLDISDIVDGDTSELNGFAGEEDALGIIDLDLIGDFTLSSFTLWNDINIRAEGVETFLLRFFSPNQELVDTTGTLTAPEGQAAGEVYDLSFLGDAVISRVELEVLTVLNSTRIEIREVAFDGEPAAAVPLPASVLLMAPAFAFLRRKARQTS